VILTDSAWLRAAWQDGKPDKKALFLASARLQRFTGHYCSVGLNFNRYRGT
jgi:hypothetical protein